MLKLKKQSLSDNVDVKNTWREYFENLKETLTDMEILILQSNKAN